MTRPPFAAISGQGETGSGMRTDVDKERSQAFAKDAMAWLAQRGIPPAPENFEIAYTYVGLENPDLKRTVDELAGNGCKFDSNIMGILHQRYFRAKRSDDAMAESYEFACERLRRD